VSNASAEVFFDDGDILYGIYHGASDYMDPFLSRDRDEPWEFYRCTDRSANSRWKGEGRAFDRIKCDHEGEHVLVRSNYGSGTFREGSACRECLVFKGPFDHDDCEDGSLVPSFDTGQQAKTTDRVVLQQNGE